MPRCRKGRSAISLVLTDKLNKITSETSVNSERSFMLQILEEYMTSARIDLRMKQYKRRICIWGGCSVAGGGVPASI